MTIKIVTVCVCVCVLLSGCGIAAKVNARNDLEQSKAAYKDCLSQHPDDIPACAGLHTAYEADLNTYRAMTAGVQPGTNNTMKVNSTSQ
jgi:hypothetical protein